MKGSPAARPPLDRTHPPEIAGRHGFEFPAFLRRNLDNGLVVYAAPMGKVPLVHMEILMPAGGQYDAVGRPGLASLHSELIDEGSEGRSALEIAEVIESLGGSMAPGTGWNMSYVELGLLAHYLDEGMDLMAEVVRRPSFPSAEVERRRQQRLAEILRRRTLPTSLADARLSEVIYGGTVYGQPLIGWEETVGSLDREDLLEFYRRHVGPRGSKILVVGDFEPERLFGTIEQVWGDWQAGEPPVAPVIEPPSLEETRVHLVDRPGSSQTQLLLGHASLPRLHPEFHRFLLLNTILGGKFTSRINLNLRERHGFTYGANSSLARRRGPGPFTVRTAVGTPVAGAAVRELMHELRRIREELVTEQELADTQRYLTGVFPYTLQTVGDILKRLEALAVFDLEDDYYQHYPALLLDITREELLETAQRHLQPERMAIVAVGPAAELREQFEGIGPVIVSE